MRMRRKKWARPELAQCPYYIPRAEDMRGKWHTAFKDNSKPIYAELGCGKGVFAAQAALKYPDINWLAVDIKSEMLAVGRRTIEKAFAEAGKTPDNVLLVTDNISFISSAFSEEDVVDRIYINFCNPWPRGKHQKRRLTHPRQLLQYRIFLRDNGEIHFKTDDDQLFEESIPYFEECGFEITYLTRDLHASGYEYNLETEHEKMFTAEGKKIKFLIAVKNKPVPQEVYEKYTYEKREEEDDEQDSEI